MASARIMLVEDDKAICTMLEYNLVKRGYKTMIARDGAEAALLLEEKQPDLIILDWMLPKISGIELCRRIRSKSALRHLPILILTARSGEADRIRGLETGADDYIVKPFFVSELMARIQAVLRRMRPSLIEEVHHYGPLVLDRAAHTLRCGDKPVALGPTEFRLMLYFLQNKGRVLSREQLLNAVWGDYANIETRTVDVHIGRLRKALLKVGRGECIATVRSAGYVLRPEDQNISGKEGKKAKMPKQQVSG